ncbi:tripartite motif-containing protein 2-like [Ptychodera flava]|uniref:tripartite motif-containing protein 2-like n=1 Tax=Ptychodera flava TaxID=63121 RepID=UPI00396A3A32
MSHRPMTCKEENLAAKSNDPVSGQQPLYCTRHPDNPMSFYCDTCDVVICHKCTTLDHSITGHKYRYLDNAAAEYSKDLKAVIDKVKMKENEASRSKVVVMEMIRSLDRCYYREEKKMTRHIQKRRVTRLGRKYGDMLLRELNDVYDKRKSDLNTQLTELERIKCDMSHAREYTEKLMHYGNAAQLMSAKKDIASRMKQLLNVETKTDPDETDYMEFQPCDDFYATKSVGVLLVSTTPADHCQLVDVPDFVRKDDDIIFTMIATDVKGTETMDRNVEISTVMKRPDNTLEDITAINNNDGTWSLKTKAKMTGKHEMTVSVFKKPVKGSPVTVNVIPMKGLICEFGKYGLGREELGDVYGVMVTRNQNIRFCDNSNGRLKTFTVDGKYICTTKFSNISTRVTPLFSAVSEDGSVFTTEDNFRQVIVHKENGRVMRCFGEGVIYFHTALR